MNLGQLLTPDQILPAMASTGHREAIRELVDHLDDHHLLRGASHDEVLHLLFQREEQISTGIGSGVAIPHAFVPSLEHVVAAFGRSQDGIEFAALDHAPVHFVILFVVPETEYHLHLRTLAAIAKMFTNRQIRDELSRARDGDEILEILSRRPARA